MTGYGKHDCHALWIGPTLPPLVGACLRSFLRAGHRVVLHSYRTLSDVPKGIELADANLILPEGKIVRHHRSKSPSLFSNYFRYRLMCEREGYWIDCDLYCVRPFDFGGNPVFGWQDQTTINGAVLRLSPDSDMLRDCLALFESRDANFPWVEKRSIRRARFKSFFYRKPMISFLPWGSAGPNAITWLAKKHGDDASAQRREVFYPLGHKQADRLGRSDFDIESVLASDTRCIHLWNEMLRQFKTEPEPGSLLDRLRREADDGPPAIALH